MQPGAWVPLLTGGCPPMLSLILMTKITLQSWSLREIEAELAQRGIMNERGQPFSAASIASMLERRSL